MSSSKRYFQLSSDILVEYDYATVTDAGDQTGKSDHVYDLCDESGNVLGSVINTMKYNGTKMFLYDTGTYMDRLVVPTNMSESKFIRCSNSTGSKIWGRLTEITYGKIDGLGSESTSDVMFDTFRLHFTGRNFFGDYDGLILRAYVYDTMKNKICLFSHLMKRTDDLNLNPNPMMINQKLYTTYVDYDIISANGIINHEKIDSILPGEKVVHDALFGENRVMTNSPIVFALYGVKSAIDYNSFEYYNVEKINAIYIPVYDDYGSIEVVVEEASDGDYFEIYPRVNGGKVSFSDYLRKIAGDRIDTFIVFHDITLTEYFVDRSNNVRSKTTYRSQYILNAAVSDETGTLIANEDELDRHILYRPIAMNAYSDVCFVIKDQMKILNTLDNTSIIKEGTMKCETPKRYGKHMGDRINLGTHPVQVKVYNKKQDLDIDGVKITKSGSGVRIQNTQHSITGFIESVNVGVSIEQIPASDIN